MPPTRSTNSPAPAEHAARAEWYAKEVVAGRIPAGKLVRLACQRHLDDLKRKGFPFKFEPDCGARVCRFIETFQHTKGRWAALHQNVKLEPWQCFIIVILFGWIRKKNGTRRFRTAYLELPRKNGKALDVETPIPTPTGWVRHGDLKAGDLVFDAEGQPQRVVDVTEHYAGPCMAVGFSDGAEIVAHEAHEWATKRTWYTGRPKGPWGKVPLPLVETREVARTLTGGARGDLVHSIPVVGALACAGTALPIHPYLLGVWLGDGDSNNAAITGADEEVFDRIRQLGFPLSLRATRAGIARKYGVTAGRGGTAAARAASIQTQLATLGVLKNKHIPAAYLRAAEEDRWELLRGLMDTDGTVSKAGQAAFDNTNEMLVQGFAELARTLGLKPTLREDRALLYGVDCGPVWTVQFWPLEGQRIAYVPRKHLRSIEGVKPGKRRSQSRMITKVEPVGDRIVNCIQVERGLYLAGESMIPTHNSLTAAGIGLYMLMADNEFGAEVYSGATSERQAHEVWRPAKLMLERNERLRKKLGASVWARALAVEANGSKFETVIGDPGDGASPSCAIVDEYHEHQTPRLYDTMETGMGARDQPLMLVITTAGTNIAGPCHEKHSEVAKMLEGTLENEELFGIVYGIDPGDRWEDPASLRKANPNFGVSVDEEFLLSQQRQAMQSPVQQTKFKTKHLNVWCSVYAGVMNMQQWALCADPMLEEEELAGADCWIAVDLASKSDLCAAQRLYRKEIAGRAHYYLFGSHWLPEEAVEEPGPNHAHYVKWRNKGLLTQTDGATVDFDLITETLIEDCKRINPQEVVFDPFNAVQMMQAVMRQNITAVEFIQTPQNFAVPLDELLSAVKDGRFHHDGNEITTWCVSNMVARPAKKGLVAPIKQKPHQKIDSAIAICMCMARASTAPTEQPDYQMLFV